MLATFESISHIFKKSIFNQLGEALTIELLKRGQLVTAHQGATINSGRKVNEFCILLEGKVELYSRVSGKRVESLKVGRSFELDALYNGNHEWRFDWIAGSEVRLFTVSFSDFLSVIAADSSLSRYLELVTTSIAVQKLKNDLRMLGITDATIRDVIASMESHHSLETIKEESFVLLNVGDVKVELKTQDWQELVEIRESDYFFFYPEEDLRYTAGRDLHCLVVKSELFVSKLPEVSKYPFIEKIHDKAQDFSLSGAGKEPVETEELLFETGEEDFDIEEFKKNPKKKIRGRKVAIIQHDMMDCGAACMSMISAFYGKKLNISFWRNIIHVTREGASMLAIKKGAALAGLDSMGVRSGYKGLLNLRTPFVALMSYHYVVVYEISEKKVLVADPEKGMVTYTAEGFKENFSKNCILVKPNKKFKAIPESRSTFRKYFVLTDGIKSYIVDLLCLSGLIFLTTLTIPVFFQFIFDTVLKNQSQVVLNITAAIVVGLNVLLGFSSHVRQRIIANLSSILNIKLTALFFRKILTLPLSYFMVRNVGDISSRFAEVKKLTEFISEKGATFFVNFISLFGYAAVLIFYDLSFLYLLGFILFFCSVVLYALLKKIKLNLQLSFSLEGKTRSLIYEHFRAMASLRATNSTDSAYLKWREKFYKGLWQRKELQGYFSLTQSFIMLVSQLISLSFILLSIYLYMAGGLSLGQVVAVNILSQSLLTPLVAMIKDWDDVNKVLVSLEKIDEIVTSPSEDFREKGKTALQGDIVFEKVWFRYGSETTPWIVKDLSITIKKGETVAFVGRSGSGKSTLSYLVNLLYQPTKGQVSINGVDNKDIDLRHLRDRCSVVLQESSLYDGSILENICMGEPLDFDRVKWACKIAEADDFIMGLEAGYETVIKSSQVALSGGQKQRLSIARAIYTKPEILILDEATSALDPITERKVVTNLRQECKGMSSIIIAHRFNTIMHADQIFVLDSGTLKERGTHGDLLKQRGIYFKMLRNQLA